jgi:hypothetical protein
MRTETAAGELASHLPGDYRRNIEDVMRLRAKRIHKLRGAGLDVRAIAEATGWTERQQRYALQRFPNA